MFKFASVLVSVVLAASAAPAYAAGHPDAAGGSTSTSTSGSDISYPQCNRSFPKGAAFGIVGVNNGIVYSPNPCLGTGDGPSELSWALNTGKPGFYANTADPGPAYSSHWPTSAVTINGQVCDPSTAVNSPGCSYVYGYQAAQNSFADAVTAEQQVSGSDISTATLRAAATPWWLDVETGNSWQTLESAYGNTSASQANDTAALQGAVAALHDAGVTTTVGFYSTSYQWNQITGGTATAFSSNPNWVAGFSSASSAVAGCTTANSFTGGKVALTQYTSKGFDADHAC